jgi:DNA-binding CsgD family transcriptional regulator
MNASFTAADLARCESLSRTLLSPLAAESVDDWRRDVNRAVRTLFDGDAAVFMLPGADVLYVSDDAGMVAGLERYASLTADGKHLVQDPVVSLWQDMRRTEGLEAFSWAINAHMVKQRGEEIEHSPFVQEVLFGSGLRNFVGTYTQWSAGEVLLWVLQEKAGHGRFGDHDADVMRAFVPSLRAGLAVLDHLHAHRATLDLVDAPTAVFDLGGREIVRNASLTSLLAACPDADALLGTIRQAAEDARRCYAPRRSEPSAPFAPATRTFRAPHVQYHVRATIVGAGAFDRDESILVSVQTTTAPSLPGTEALAGRFDLTPREAEVALLLADGRSNAEIAEQLFISPHTTKRHVEKVLAKLEVSSRAKVLARLLDPAA